MKKIKKRKKIVGLILLLLFDLIINSRYYKYILLYSSFLSQIKE